MGVYEHKNLGLDDLNCSLHGNGAVDRIRASVQVRWTLRLVRPHRHLLRVVTPPSSLILHLLRL